MRFIFLPLLRIAQQTDGHLLEYLLQPLNAIEPPKAVFDREPEKLLVACRIDDRNPSA